MPVTRSVRISAVLGAATVAGLGLGAASAEACTVKPPPGHPCGESGTIPATDIQFQEAGATTWTDADVHSAFPAEPAGGVVNVRINPQSWYATAACTSAVSLASYETDGPTWATSGVQVFVGHAGAQLSSAHPSAALAVPLPGASAGKPTCWGQVDLYFGTTVFDGHAAAGHGPLPHFPNGVFPSGLISWWNGGKSSCAATPPPTPPPSTTPPPTQPPTSPPTSVSTTKPPKPPTTKPPTSTTSVPPTTTTTSVEPTTVAPTTPVTPTPTATSTTDAVVNPPPATTTPATPVLATTGSDTAPLAMSAFGLVGAGGAVMLSVRRVSRRH